MERHSDTFAGIFVASTGIQLQTWNEMCKEALNPHIDTDTSNFNVHAVFVSRVGRESLMN